MKASLATIINTAKVQKSENSSHESTKKETWYSK